MSDYIITNVSFINYMDFYPKHIVISILIGGYWERGGDLFQVGGGGGSF